MSKEDEIKLLAQCLKDYDRKTGQLTRMVRVRAQAKDHAPMSVWEWFSSPSPIIGGKP